MKRPNLTIKTIIIRVSDPDPAHVDPDQVFPLLDPNKASQGGSSALQSQQFSGFGTVLDPDPVSFWMCDQYFF